MKKLLSILAAVGLTATASSSVVACSSKKSKSSSSKLKSTIDWSNGDEKIVSLTDGESIRVKDFMSNSKNLNQYLLNRVNQLVGDKYAEDFAQTNITSTDGDKLGLWDTNENYRLQGDNSTNSYANEISNYNYISLATSLYQEYVNSYLNDTTPFDETAFNESDYLNPIKDNDGNRTRSYSIWFTDSKDGKSYKRWTTDAETEGLDLGTSFLPNPDELATGSFIIVNDSKGTMPNGDNGSKFTSVTDLTKTKDDLNKDGLSIVGSDMSGQRALTYRFQSYLQTKNADSMINALVMEYEKNTMFKLQDSANKENGAKPFELAANKSLYVDTSSSFASKVQSWPTKGTDPITSNYKMVWTLTLSKEDAKTVNEAINKDVLAQDKLGLSTNDFSVFDKAQVKSLADLKNSLTGWKDNKNLAPKGTDPIFGISGYQGIVNDGKVIDGGSLDISSDAANKISKAEGFGIVKKTTDTAGQGVYNFDSKDGSTQDFVIVMPIYLMDLLQNGQSSANSNPQSFDNTTPSENSLTNVALNQWVELNPQVGDKWNSSSKFGIFNGAEEWDKTNKGSLPTKNVWMKSNNKYYVFLTNATPVTTTLNDNQTITITGHNTVDDEKDLSGYGISGTYKFKNNSSLKGDDLKDAQALNGQNVNYQIHLGMDSNNPTSYEKDWNTNHLDQKVNDIENLTNAKKTELMNNLLAVVAKNDTSIQEETKNSIYRSYISLDDIYYQGLYDEISKYLKSDDKTDESN